MTRSWNAIGYKILILLVAAIGLWFISRNDTPTANGGEPLADDITRNAYNITMQDANLQTGAITFIRVQRITEKMGRFLLLDNLVIDKADKVHLSGDRARYDMKLARLDVTGNIILTTPEGIQGNLESLTWDKASHKAWTDRPVRFTTTDGIIKADKAVLLDDLEEITLMGGVYAQMAGDTFRSEFSNKRSR